MELRTCKFQTELPQKVSLEARAKRYNTTFIM